MTKAERAERKAWLDGLKAGDEVCVERTDGQGGIPSICRVTSAHFDLIHVDEGRGLGCTTGFSKSNGRVDDRRFHGPKWIVPVTAEHREKNRVRDARHRLTWQMDVHKWANVSDETVLGIVALLDSDEEAKKGKA